MWEILTDVILEKSFGLRLPPSRVPWDGPVSLPHYLRLLFCLDRAGAKMVQADIQQRYQAVPRNSRDWSIFDNYGLSVTNSMERERDGFDFLARQAKHFRSLDDYVFVILNEDVSW